MTFSERFNNWFHPIMIRRVARKYQRKISYIEKHNPSLFAPVDAENTKKFLHLWGKFGLPMTDKWLRFLSNVSGIVDYTYCPDDIYYSIIERVLNNCEWGIGGMSDKNMMGCYIRKEDAPYNHLRYMRGRFCDQDYNTLTDKMAQDVLRTDHGDLIGKVVDSSGGKGVDLFVYCDGRYVDRDGEELTTDRIMALGTSYMLQEKVPQCEFAAKFNPSSCNTCRLITLRRPWDGITRVVAAGMRFGAGSSVVDNMSQGGYCVAIGPKGELGKFAATNWYKTKPIDRHPVSGIVFDGQVHPYFSKMCELASSYAATNPYMNIISWDMVADSNGSIKIIEINPAGQGVDWPQFDFGSLFGADTEQLVDWCVKHYELNQFSHLRTWY